MDEGAAAELSKEQYGRLLERLTELAQGVGTALDLTTVFRALLAFVKASAPCNGIFVSLYDAEKQQRTCVFAWSEGREEDAAALPPLPMSDSPNSRAVRTGQVIVTDDLEAALSGQPRVNLGLDLDPRLPRSSISVPMIVLSRVIGAFEVQSTRIAAYNQEHVTALRVAANLAAIATENVTLLERERAARAAAEGLNEVLEDRVRARTFQLEQAYKELESFSYSVSHDLRAPLRGIDGFSQALLEHCGSSLDETAIGYLRRVRAATQRMGVLIDAMLNLSRLSRLEPKRQIVDLSALTKRLLAQLQEAQPERRVLLQVAENMVAQGDESLLEVLLDNLLTNAWKYTRTQEITCIEVASLPTSDGVVYMVKDNGVGFEMRYADKLFTPFQRLHRAEEFEGTGIGLATAQRIVHRHGGRIWAEAEPGEGARFYFELGT